MSEMGSAGAEQTLADIERATEPTVTPQGKSARKEITQHKEPRPLDGLAVHGLLAGSFARCRTGLRLLPVVSALWVLASDRTGKDSPPKADYIGMDNDQTLLTKPGLAQRDLATSLRNSLYYVILVVPLQTILALVVAVALSRRRLRGKGLFRSAFYFTSVTSSVAISIVFLFLLNASGVVNAMLAWFGQRPQLVRRTEGCRSPDPRWPRDDTDSPPSWLIDDQFMGPTWWQWLSGPGVAMCAIIALAVWTTSDTFMLLFLAA